MARQLRVAFQPIVVERHGGWSVFAYEALVRGAAGEPAGEVLAALRQAADPHVLDLACRLAGLRDAAALGLHRSEALLSLNVLPSATLNPETCLGATLAAARRLGFAPDQILFEITEAEQSRDPGRLRDTVAAQRAHGVRIAIDDFGAGYAGLGLLVEFQPDIVKLDMQLLRGVDRDPVRARIVAAIARVCHDLGITMIAEGIETPEELAALHDMGIRHFQGYLLARPALGALPDVIAEAVTLSQAAPIGFGKPWQTVRRNRAIRAVPAERVRCRPGVPSDEAALPAV
ncbi:EAL domain-containing protein [Elioraea tepidiphila]|uniref:EAL domain-containing protein n=1 Tax=Elioraea tepidiphila TaxID=457934 RepID=UPI00036E6AA8|nr:EAL domain-containing protein [Elioraea tepidiphila]